MFTPVYYETLLLHNIKTYIFLKEEYIVVKNYFHFIYILANLLSTFTSHNLKLILNYFYYMEKPRITETTHVNY